MWGEFRSIARTDYGFFLRLEPDFEPISILGLNVTLAPLTHIIRPPMTTTMLCREPFNDVWEYIIIPTPTNNFK